MLTLYHRANWSLIIKYQFGRRCVGELNKPLLSLGILRLGIISILVNSTSIIYINPSTNLDQQLSFPTLIGSLQDWMLGLWLASAERCVCGYLALHFNIYERVGLGVIYWREFGG
jgi:hypothetical protein